MRRSWSNEKLLFRLIANKTNKTYWFNIAELRKRCSLELFERCKFLTKSNVEKERIIGVDILSQLSNPIEIRPYSKEVVLHFIDLLKIEDSPSVLMSIFYGLGHNNENLVLDEDIRLVASYKMNKHTCVREGVVFALLGIDNEVAIDALIELSKDRYSNIRNWSIFGLGSQIERDNLSIREALYERIKDKHSETKYEAILGLVKRNDPRVREVIKKELLTDSYDSLLFEAIEELNETIFLPLLENSLGKSKRNKNINPKWIEDLEYCIGKLKLSPPPPIN